MNRQHSRRRYNANTGANTDQAWLLAALLVVTLSMLAAVVIGAA